MKNNLQICRFSILKSITEIIFLTIPLLIVTQQVLGQFTDNFSDDNFNNDPAWSGTDFKFIVADGMLKLQAEPVSDVAHLSLPCKVVQQASWEFLVKLGFNPSGANYARIYLMSDQPDLTTPVRGYYVQVGSTTDDVSLVEQSGSTHRRIIDGRDGLLDQVSSSLKIRVSRDSTGQWELFTHIDTVGTPFSEGIVRDETHTKSEYFGVSCTYTATRADKFFFDDFRVVGDEYVPSAAPAVSPKGLIFTEIFADPTPRVGLPEVEFVELFNRSPSTIDLRGWHLEDQNSRLTFSDVEILPGEYLIVSPSVSGAYDSYGKAWGSTDFPSLNNTGDVIRLLDANGTLIDSVYYSDNWYKSSEVKNGGWSLELIDPENLCSGASNWIASVDPSGGTPGRQNSAFASKPDLTGPKLVAAIPLSPQALQLTFNEALEKLLPDPTDFVITPLLPIDQIAFGDASLTTLILSLNQNLLPATGYTVEALSVYDCAGNQNPGDANKLAFALPEQAEPGDILINEILFNPRPLGVDFVEIVNTSHKYINLKNFYVSNLPAGTPTNKQRIRDTDFLFPPAAYLVLVENADALLGEYPLTPTDRILEIDKLPAFNDDAGSVAILTDNEVLLDFFVYTDDMHTVFLKNKEGVSLERIGLNDLSNESQNWKSASSIVGFATPGYLNSNAQPAYSVSQAAIEISPKAFDPLVGTPNFTQIHFRFEQGGNIGTVSVFDDAGRLIKTLANNEVLGTEGTLRWDGDSDNGNKARIGYYMILFEIFDVAGNTRSFRNGVAITGRF